MAITSGTNTSTSNSNGNSKSSSPGQAGGIGALADQRYEHQLAEFKRQVLKFRDVQQELQDTKAREAEREIQQAKERMQVHVQLHFNAPH